MMNGTARFPETVSLRLGRTGWMLVVVGMTAAAWFGGLFAPLASALLHLASQPEVASAFTHPEHGRVDALLLMISVLLLSPFALFLLLVALLFAVIVAALLLEPVLQSARLPGWFSAPLVLAATAWTAYVLREMWIGQATHTLALVARAYFVYFGPGPAAQ